MSWGIYQSLFEKATEYALDMFGNRENGWDVITKTHSVARAVELLGAEYNDAKSEERGMDRTEVRRLVQTILDAANFPTDNQPPEYDPDAPTEPFDPDLRVFAYIQNGLGRPRGRQYDDDAIAYTIGAVVGCFSLKTHPASFSRDVNKERKPSAIEVVVEAQRRRERHPMSVDGVRKAFARSAEPGAPKDGESYRVGLTEGHDSRLNDCR